MVIGAEAPPIPMVPTAIGTLFRATSGSVQDHFTIIERHPADTDIEERLFLELIQAAPDGGRHLDGCLQGKRILECGALRLR